MKLTSVMAGALVAALGSIAAPAFAQAGAAAPAAQAAPAGPLKIGTVNFQYVIAKSNEGQRDFGTLRTKFGPREQALETQANEIANLQKQLQNTGANLSDDERAKRVHDIETRQKDFQRAQEDLQKEEQEEGQQTFQRIERKVGEYLTQYAQQNGYTLILADDAQVSPILYENPAINVSDAIVTGYNAKSGVPAPPPSAAPAAAPRRTTPSTSGTKSTK